MSILPRSKLGFLSLWLLCVSQAILAIWPAFILFGPVQAPSLQPTGQLNLIDYAFRAIILSGAACLVAAFSVSVVSFWKQKDRCILVLLSLLVSTYEIGLMLALLVAGNPT